MRAKFVKLKSWDWNICSSVAHPPPLCISSRVPVNPTCVSSQTLCFILYILFKPLPVNSYFSCIPKHQLDSFCILLFHCQYTPFSRKHLYILPNTIWFFLLYTLHPFQTTASILLSFFQKENTFISSQTPTWCFLLYTLYPFPNQGECIYWKRKHVHISIYPIRSPPGHQAIISIIFFLRRNKMLILQNHSFGFVFGFYYFLPCSAAGLSLPRPFR